MRGLPLRCCSRRPSAPLSVVAPMASLGIVLAAVFAARGWIVAREPAAPIDMLGMFLTIAGVCLSAAFGPSGSTLPTVESMGATMSEPPFLTLTAVTFGVIFSWLGVQKLPACRSCKPGEDHPVSAIVSSLCSGGCASFAFMFLKTLMVGSRLTIDEGSPLIDMPWNFWVAAGLLGPVAISQVYLLEMTLASGSTNYVIPVYTGTLVIVAGVQAGIVFREFDQLSSFSISLFCSGVIIASSGLAILSVAQHRRAKWNRAERKNGEQTSGEAAASTADEPQSSSAAQYAHSGEAGPDVPQENRNSTTLAGCSHSASPSHSVESTDRRSEMALEVGGKCARVAPMEPVALPPPLPFAPRATTLQPMPLAATSSLPPPSCSSQLAHPSVSVLVSPAPSIALPSSLSPPQPDLSQRNPPPLAPLPAPSNSSPLQLPALVPAGKGIIRESG